MLAIILGVLFILGGIAFGTLAFFAAGMSSRPTTNWEAIYTPLLCFGIPVATGILIIVLRHY